MIRGRDAQQSRLAEVYPDRLGLGMGNDDFKAFVASIAGLLATAPWLRHVAVIEAVDPDQAGLDIFCKAMRGTNIAGPDSRRKPVDRVIGDLHGLLGRIEGIHCTNRTEDLLARDPHAVVHAGEQSRLEVSPVIPVRGHATAHGNLRALAAADVDTFQYPFLLVRVDHCTECCRGIERIARHERLLRQRGETLREILGDAPVDQQS